MQISKTELKKRFGIDLQKGKYSIYLRDGFYEIYTVKDDTEGCLLVGYNKKKGMVLDSKKTLSNLMYKLNVANDIKEKVYIEIK